MEKAIRFHATGGPEVLRLEDVAVGEPHVHHGDVGPELVVEPDGLRREAGLAV